MAGTAGCLQGPGVWPRPRCLRFMVLNKHLHTGCQDPSQQLIKTFHWNPCEVADPPTLRQQPAAYLCTPQTHTLCVCQGKFFLRHQVTVQTMTNTHYLLFKLLKYNFLKLNEISCLKLEALLYSAQAVTTNSGSVRLLKLFLQHKI